MILTLKDSDVLADEEGANSTLVNVNMADDDRTRKRLDDAKKARVGYNAYDMEEVSTGVLEQRGFLELLFLRKRDWLRESSNFLLTIWTLKLHLFRNVINFFLCSNALFFPSPD